MNHKKEFHFQKLDYQEEASNAIISVFSTSSFLPANNDSSNPLLERKVTLEKNYENNVIEVEELENQIKDIRASLNISVGKVEVHKEEPLNLDILMETGTGKTFTFIETIFKLNKEYKLSKFIILVPNIAIKMGTLKNLKATSTFFQKEYKKQIHVFDYSPKNIKTFIRNHKENISVLVMNSQAFNKKDNLLNQKGLESPVFQGSRSYMEDLARLHPVIIMDEPHRFEGKKTKEFLPHFQSQMILRFGATFKDGYTNLIYSLDSKQAFLKNLVKSISVETIGIEQERDQHLLEFLEKKKQLGIAIMAYKDNHNKLHKKEVKEGDNLGEVFQLDVLKDYVVEKITEKELFFQNGFVLDKGERSSYSLLLEEVRRKILERTIDSHFEREEDLFKKNIKSLSLIFINERKKYLQDTGEKGELALLFESLYSKKLEKVLSQENLEEGYRKYLEATKESCEKVHGGYFAISNTLKSQEEAIELILNKKEEMLSFVTPLRFIFSQWALQEGWDNPNIFTLCKLAPTSSKITKLQQIGRGLRLALKQTPSGFERVTYPEDERDSFYYEKIEEFENVNELTVIVPSEEGNFVKEIQEEIEKNSFSNTYLILTEKILIDKKIVVTSRQANKLLDSLEKKSLISWEDEKLGKALILNDRIPTEVIEAIEKEEIDFRSGLLRKHFKESMYLASQPISSKVRVKGEPRTDKNQVYKINSNNWKKIEEMMRDLYREASFSFNLDEEALKSEFIAKINDSFFISPKAITVNQNKKVERGKKDSEEIGREEIGSSLSTFSLEEFLQEIFIKTEISYPTILGILKGIHKNKFEMIFHNPKEAVLKISEIFNNIIYQKMERIISFNINEYKVGENAFLDKEGSLREYIQGSLGKNQYILEDGLIKDRSLTENLIGYDSAIELETIEKSNISSIRVFTKLPFIKIPVPGGKEYNPDFAYVIETNKGDIFHLVIETKGVDSLEEGLRPMEKVKIQLAKKYFDALRGKTGIPIFYETKINKETLSAVIGRAMEKFKQLS